MPYKCLSTDYIPRQLNSAYILNYIPEKYVLVLCSHAQRSQKRLFPWGFDMTHLLAYLVPSHPSYTSCPQQSLGLSILILGKPFKFPTLVAARSKVLVCGRSLAGIVGSNSAEGIDVCLLWVLSVLKDREVSRPSWSLVQGRVLPRVVCGRVWSWSSTMRRPWPTMGCYAMGGGVGGNPHTNYEPLLCIMFVL